MAADITYEELEKMYTKISKFNTAPDLIYTSLSSAVEIFGKKEVEKMIADGTIRFVEDCEGIYSLKTER